jgi:hypothetical protein
MTSSEAARSLGPLAALWPSLNEQRRATIWQGLNQAERQAVALLFGSDDCPGLGVDFPQDEESATAECDETSGDVFSEHRARWQAQAVAGQREVRRNTQIRVEAVVEQPAANNVNLNRQRWQRAMSTGHLAVKSKAPAAIRHSPGKTSQLNRDRCGFWCRMHTVLVCLCMTPIPYVFIAWLLWLACRS